MDSHSCPGGIGVETERWIGMDEMGTGTTLLYLHLRKDSSKWGGW